MREGDAAVQDLWRRYKASESVTLRNELVLSYLSLVRYVASRVAAGLPDNIDREDLVSYGTIGLIDAIGKFDISRDNKFDTYAVPRIRGEIVDQLRKQDRVPRSVRSKARLLAGVRTELEGDLGRDPADHEVADRMGITLEALWVMQRQAAVAALIPLDDHDDDDDRPTLQDTLSDASSNPEDLYGPESEIVDLLAAAIDALPPRYKTILVLYYLHEMTLACIGQVLGVTESRVCQLQGRLLESLRESLAHGSAAIVAA